MGQFASGVERCYMHGEAGNETGGKEEAEDDRTDAVVVRACVRREEYTSH